MTVNAGWMAPLKIRKVDRADVGPSDKGVDE